MKKSILLLSIVFAGSISLAYGIDDNLCRGNDDGLYDCMFKHGPFTIVQSGLDQTDIDTLFGIWHEKEFGNYTRPPIQESSDDHISSDSPLCAVPHYSKLLKQQYNC